VVIMESKIILYSNSFNSIIPHNTEINDLLST